MLLLVEAVMMGANEKLRQFFGKCRDGSIRVIKVSIENENLTLADYAEKQGSWEDDYDLMVLSLLEDEQPTYILYRLDSRNASGYDWLLISWSPDFSPVREKMLYASTKATLKKEFGGGQIKEELFGVAQEDVSLHGYHRHKMNVASPAPLTPAEEELAEIRRVETGVDVGVDTKHQTMQGIAFPIDKSAILALEKMKSGLVNYIQLNVDVEKEVIKLDSTADINIQTLASHVPCDHPRYHVFRFPHSHEGDFLQSIVFIYSMPGDNCPIKERMLYSSCKAPFLDVLEKQIGLEIAKKIEIEDANELTEEFLQDEIHPKKNLYRPKFAKPSPPNRGARRITKPQQQSDEGVVI